MAVTTKLKFYYPCRVVAKLPDGYRKRTLQQRAGADIDLWPRRKQSGGKNIQTYLKGFFIQKLKLK